MLIGYARVSTVAQDVTAQRDALVALSCGLELISAALGGGALEGPVHCNNARQLDRELASAACGLGNQQPHFRVKNIRSGRDSG